MVVLAASIVTKGGKGICFANFWLGLELELSAHSSMLMQSEFQRCISTPQLLFPEPLLFLLLAVTMT